MQDHRISQTMRFRRCACQPCWTRLKRARWRVHHEWIFSVLFAVPAVAVRAQAPDRGGWASKPVHGQQVDCFAEIFGRPGVGRCPPFVSSTPASAAADCFCDFKVAKIGTLAYPVAVREQPERTKRRQRSQRPQPFVVSLFRAGNGVAAGSRNEVHKPAVHARPSRWARAHPDGSPSSCCCCCRGVAAAVCRRGGGVAAAASVQNARTAV